ncbi:MAG: cytochrome c [Vicinamibacterales bacterium]
MTSSHNLRLVACALGLLLIAGCRQDMHNQPKYRPLRESAFFRDTSSARPIIEGTVARGTLQEDEALFTGKLAGATVKELPFAIEAKDLDRGQERFNIYCTPCHDKTGDGRGMVVQRGYRQPPSFHIDRLKTADAGYIFDVITNGFGAMPDYKAQIDARDRWLVVAYIRALQLSQSATAADVPGGNPDTANSKRPATGHQPAGGGKH